MVLAQWAREHRPGMEVIVTTGHAEQTDAITRHGELSLALLHVVAEQLRCPGWDAESPVARG